MIFYQILCDGEEVERLKYPILREHEKVNELWEYVTRQGLRSINGFSMVEL